MDVWQALSIGAVGLCAGLVLIGLIRFAGSPIARPLLGVAACGALWAVGDMINLGSRDLISDQIGLVVLYSGSIFLPALWALLALRWAAARGSPLPPFAHRLWRLSMVWAGGMWLVMLTNPWHHRFLIPVVGDRSILLPLWWGVAIPSYAFLVSAVGVQLWVSCRVRVPSVRREAAMMICAGLIVLLANSLSVFWLQSALPLQGMVLALAAAGTLLFAGLRLEDERRHFEESLSREVDVRTRQLDDANRDLRFAYERLRELQGQLLRAERLGAEEYLAGSVAHSINNPLAALMGRVEMALEARNGDEATLREMLGLAQRIGQVVEGTLSLVRRRSLTLALEAPAAMLEEVCEQLSATAVARGIAIEFKASAGLPEVVVDRSLLVAAMVGIAENAIDAMKENGGHLWLEAEAIPAIGVPALSFRIADSGPGIPRDLRAKVFKPFFTTKPGGTGLGLAVARGVIQGHAGRIRIDDRPGGGTLFTIEIPLSLPGVTVPDRSST
jgi:signal transduction histidine kinase